jgi:hypothetical protein
MNSFVNDWSRYAFIFTDRQIVEKVLRDSKRESLSTKILELQNDELEGQFLSFLSNRQYDFSSAEKSDVSKLDHV